MTEGSGGVDFQLVFCVVCAATVPKRMFVIKLQAEGTARMLPFRPAAIFWSAL